MNPKIIAMYLPQFHRIPENDEWWGDGFTEWTTVKAAKPLFEGHKQPVVPANKYYYNLLDRDTMKWQISLMKDYGIYGMCVYHYWFKDGRKILEKPAEMLLADNTLDTHYCFCWANESWLRSWSNFGEGNVWASNFERKSEYKDCGILLEQQYGSEKDWKEHFRYLLPFFKDTRYIKVDNKPVFLIYRPALIFCLEEMCEAWKTWAREEGFDGVYFVFANCDDRCRKIADRELYHEPQRTFHQIGAINKENMPVERAYSYDDLVKESLGFCQSSKVPVSYGGFTKYDDTPRRGNKGALIYGASPEKFKKYMMQLIAKNKHANSPFVFLNAWNEWGEGMFLEPDEDNKTTYLEALKEATSPDYCYSNMDYGMSDCIDNNENFDKKLDKMSQSKELLKARKQAEILHFWLTKKEMNRNMSDYLIHIGYSRIAVYGLGILGKHFITELSGSQVEIVCAIDKNKDAVVNDFIRRVEINDISEDIDAIIVTVPQFFLEIKNELKQYTSTRVLSIEEIIMEY